MFLPCRLSFFSTIRDRYGDSFSWKGGGGGRGSIISCIGTGGPQEPGPPDILKLGVRLPLGSARLDYTTYSLFDFPSDCSNLYLSAGFGGGLGGYGAGYSSYGGGYGSYGGGYGYGYRPYAGGMYGNVDSPFLQQAEVSW